MSQFVVPTVHPHRQHGFALISALGAVVLVALIVSLMLALTTSETQQSGNLAGLVRARALGEAGVAAQNFYLANGGLIDANNILDPYTTMFANSNKDAATTPILDSGQRSAATAALMSAAGMRQTGTLNGGTYTASVQLETLQADESSFSRAGQDYYARYRITSLGQIGRFQRKITTQGVLRFRLGRSYLNQYVLLADDGGGRDNEVNYFATGTSYDGPVHVNHNVAFFGTPSFSEGFSTNDPTVIMDTCGGRDVWVSTQASPDGCTAPNWGGHGITYAKAEVPLPQNSFSQKNAALGLDATSTTSPSGAQVCAALAVVSCGPSGPSRAGVYLAQSAGVMTGGIYVQGDAQKVVLSVGPAPVKAQLYAVTDAGGVVTTITVDPVARTTTLRVGNAPATVYTGVPNGQLYTSGNILGLAGPGRSGPLPTPLPDGATPAQISPALAPTSRLNIAAEGDVVLTGDLTYSDDPRTVPGAVNVLGVLSGQGSLRIATTAPADLYLHGAYLAGRTGKGFTTDNYGAGAPRGAVHLLGSVAESKDLPRGYVYFGNNGQLTASNGYLDDFSFDSRFENGGLAPPYFPATTKFSATSNYPEQQAFREQ